MSWYQNKTSLTVFGQSSKRKIVAIQGSERDKDESPGQNGKTKTLLAESLSVVPNDIEIDVIDLSVKPDTSIVQPCRACPSTSAFHCHYPCSCLTKNSKENPDFMHDHDVYKRLEEADGFVVFTPVNWYSVPTQLKAFFDRLVCINQTVTEDEAEELLGKEDLKNPDKTRALEKDGRYQHLLRNHFEDKIAGFFIHGDGGAADYKEYAKTNERKTITPHMPDSFKPHLEQEHEFEPEVTHAVMPLVWQCRYSGIHVPDYLVDGKRSGKGYPYSVNNNRFKKDDKLFTKSADLMSKFCEEIIRRC